MSLAAAAELSVITTNLIETCYKLTTRIVLSSRERAPSIQAIMKDDSPIQQYFTIDLLNHLWRIPHVFVVNYYSVVFLSTFCFVVRPNSSVDDDLIIIWIWETNFNLSPESMILDFIYYHSGIVISLILITSYLISKAYFIEMSCNTHFQLSVSLIAHIFFRNSGKCGTRAEKVCSWPEFKSFLYLLLLGQD